MASPRRLLILAVASLIVVAGYPASGQAQAETTTTRTFFPLNYTEFNPCVGEPVHIQGVSLFVFHVTNAPSGTMHVSSKIIPQQMTAVGLESGTTYQVSGQPATANGNAGRGEAVEFTSTNRVILNSHGGGDNSVLMLRFKSTINANGKITVDRRDSSFKCVG